MTLANSVTLGKEWGYYKRNIDKQRKERENEQKRREQEMERAQRFRGSDNNGRRDERDGGYRRR